MSPEDEILATLPKLRRFGQLLIGSEQLSDSIIVVCLEAIIENPSALAGTESVRVTLFKNFLSVLSASPFPISNEPAATPETRSPVALHLPDLTFVETQVFLLRYVERFSRDDIRHMVNVSESKLQSLERLLELKASKWQDR